MVDPSGDDHIHGNCVTCAGVLTGALIQQSSLQPAVQAMSDLSQLIVPATGQDVTYYASTAVPACVFLTGESLLHICCKIGSVDMLREMPCMQLEVNVQDHTGDEFFFVNQKHRRTTTGTHPCTLPPSVKTAPRLVVFSFQSLHAACPASGEFVSTLVQAGAELNSVARCVGPSEFWIL